MEKGAVSTVCCVSSREGYAFSALYIADLIERGADSRGLSAMWRSMVPLIVALPRA
jgi:hypothetical protein